MSQPDPPESVLVQQPESLCPALLSAVNALTYVTEKGHWGDFAAWADKGGGGIIGNPESARQHIREHHINHILAAHVPILENTSN